MFRGGNHMTMGRVRHVHSSATKEANLKQKSGKIHLLFYVMGCNLITTCGQINLAHQYHFCHYFCDTDTFFN